MARTKQTPRQARGGTKTPRQHLAKKAARKMPPRTWAPNTEPTTGTTTWVVGDAEQDFEVDLWRGPQVRVLPTGGGQPDSRTSKNGYFCLVVAGYPTGDLYFGLLCWLPSPAENEDDILGIVHWDDEGHTTAVELKLPEDPFNFRFDLLPSFVPNEQPADGLIQIRGQQASSGWMFRQEWSRGPPSRGGTVFQGRHSSTVKVTADILPDYYTLKGVQGVP